MRPTMMFLLVTISSASAIRFTRGPFGKEYLLSWNKLPFTQAEMFCESFDGRLAKITSRAEDDWLASHVTTIIHANNTGFWMGAKAMNKSRDYVWLTGGKVEDSPYKHWTASRPVMCPDDCCGLARSTYGAESWYDLRCSQSWYALCEREIDSDGDNIQYQQQIKVVSGSSEVVAWLNLIGLFLLTLAFIGGALIVIRKLRAVGIDVKMNDLLITA